MGAVLMFWQLKVRIDLLKKAQSSQNTTGKGMEVLVHLKFFR